MIRLKRNSILAHARTSVKPERLAGGYDQLEKQPVTSNNATELALRGGHGGTIPPVKHRFKPGAEWRGNAGGRPKILGDSLTKQLKAKTEDGRTVAAKVAENLINNALSRSPHSVSAFRTIREVVEPPEEEAPEKPDRGFIRMVLGRVQPCRT
jgi:hypothetical protein